MVCLLTFALPMISAVESRSLSAGQHTHGLAQIHSMHEMRASLTTTVLQDGRVLITGGFRKGPDGSTQIYSHTAELFDPKSETFIVTGDLHLGRAGHTATLLTNGKVLIAGGFTDEGMTASAELYDPSTGTFSLAGAMSTARGDFTATLLPTGDVLIAGGNVKATGSAELFHPTTNQFSPTGPMTVPRLSHTATLLPSGKVLLVGGADGRSIHASSELYDPGSGTFTASGTMSAPRYKHAAVLLKDGHTLILGGSDSRDWRGQYKSTDIYDWRSGRFTPTVDMVGPRFKLPAAVVQFPSGNVLVCGGNETIEIFDFLTKQFQKAAQLDKAYYYAAASLLNSHTVLIVGGYTDKPQSTDKAWIYTE